MILDTFVMKTLPLLVAMYKWIELSSWSTKHFVGRSNPFLWAEDIMVGLNLSYSSGSLCTSVSENKASLIDFEVLEVP